MASSQHAFSGVPALVLAVCGLLFLAACGGAASNPQAVRGGIVCLGDSFTSGTGARGGEEWPARLARRVDMPVINAGIHGDTAAGGRRRLDRDVLRYEPRIVILFLGDTDYYRGTSMSETRRALDETLRRIRNHGAVPVLVGVRPAGEESYDQMYEGLAREHGIILVPHVLKDIMNKPHLRYDGGHPNGEGYAIVAERIFAGLRPLLEEEKSGNPTNTNNL